VDRIDFQIRVLTEFSVTIFFFSACIKDHILNVQVQITYNNVVYYSIVIQFSAKQKQGDGGDRRERETRTGNEYKIREIY
jgi:hypothetical protein